jgi:hypothetical protein
MNTGMGEVVFAPLYLALPAKNVVSTAINNAGCLEAAAMGSKAAADAIVAGTIHG